MNSPHKYHAFISYRHADNKQQGRQWATWLHQAIETYEVPEDLVGKKNGLGEVIPARIYPIFRDEEELPAHADLGQSIITALDSTRLLIVLCSPRAVASTYVADEIDYFKRQGNSDRIIAAMIDGEPNTSWDKAKQSSGFSIDDECFPVPLQFEYDETGQRTEKHAEPIAADFRINNNGQQEEGWTSPEAYSQYLKSTGDFSSEQINDKVEKYQQQQHLMLLKIIAGILGVPLGELTQRDKEYQLELERQKAKKLRRWLSAVAMLAIVAVGAGVFAFIKQQQAVKAEQVASAERDKALNTQSNFLMDLAKQENDQGHYDTGLLLALNAVPGKHGGQRPALANSHELRRSVINSTKLSEFKHRDDVKHFAISNDETKIITASDDKTAIIWSMLDGKKIMTLQHEDVVRYADFSPNGKTVVTASDDNTAVLWSTSTGEKLHTMEHDLSIFKAVFSSDGELVVTAPFAGEAMIWSVRTGAKLKEFKHDWIVTEAILTSNSQRMLTVSQDVDINFLATGETKTDRQDIAIIWSVEDGKRVLTLPHQKEISHAVFSPTERTVLTSSYDHTAVLWDASNGEKQLTLQHNDAVLHAAYSEDEKYLLTASEDNTAVLWSAKDGSRIHTYQHNDDIEHVSLSKNNKYALTVSKDKSATIWSIETGNKIQTVWHYAGLSYGEFTNDSKTIVTASKDHSAAHWLISKGEQYQKFRHKEDVVRVSFNPNGKSLVTSSHDNTAALWLTTGEKIKTFKYDDYVIDALFSNDGKKIVISSRDGRAIIWSAETGEYLQEFKHTDLIEGAMFSPDDQYIIVSPKYNKIAVYSLKKGEWLLDIDPNKKFDIDNVKRVEKAAFDSSSSFIAVSIGSESVSQILLMSLEGEVINKYKHKNVTDITFSQDGKYLVTASIDGTAFLWSTSSGEKIHTFEHDDIVSYAEFSPNGKFVVTASGDDTAVIWSVKDGEKVMTYQHKDSVKHAVFSADGTKLLTASWDKTAVLWSTSNGERLQTFMHDSKVEHAVFSPDNKKVLTASSDNSAILWVVDDKLSLVERGVKKLPNNRKCFSQEERKKYFLSELTSEQVLARSCQ